MKQLFSLFLLTVFTFGTTGLVNAQTFSDISEDSVYYSAAEYLSEKGVINGYSDNSFKPYNTITRAEFTKIVLLSEYSQKKIDDIHPQAVRFYDVNGSHLWFFNYVIFAEENKIINGYGDYTFRPNNNINLAEASKIIVNTLIEKTYPSQSIDIDNHWYDSYISKLESFTAIPNSFYSHPFGAGDYSLSENIERGITRGEMIQMIYNIKKYQNPEIPGVFSENKLFSYPFNGKYLSTIIKNEWKYHLYQTGALEIYKDDNEGNGKYILYIAPFGKITGRSSAGSLSDVMAGAAGYDLLNKQFPASCIETSESFDVNDNLSGSHFYVSEKNDSNYCTGPYSGNKWIGGTVSTKVKGGTSAGYKYVFNSKYTDNQFIPENLFSISMTYKPYGYTGEEYVYANGVKTGVKKNSRHWMNKFPEKNSEELNNNLLNMRFMINKIIWK